MLNSIAVALIKSDVNLRMVKSLQEKIRNQFDEMDEDVGNKKLLIQRSVVQALQELLTSKKKPYKMLKGKSNIIMFVGLNGMKGNVIGLLTTIYVSRDLTVAIAGNIL